MKTQLTPAQCVVIRNQVEASGHSVYEEYSGRGMYGDICFGIVIDCNSDVSLFQIAFELGVLVAAHCRDVEMKQLVEIFAEAKMCSDNLGMDMIYYFPQIQWQEGDPAAVGEVEEE